WKRFAMHDTDVSFDSVLLSGLQTQVLSVSGGELLMGAVDNDDFVTNIKGFGGSTSMEFGDGTINAVGSTTINHSKSSTANPILALKNTSTTNEGRYLQFTENTGSFVGQIGRVDQTESNIFISTFDTGLKFESYITYKAILPCGTDGADVDNTIDLGSSSVRFDDIYATNGTIQTSDRNEKQDIQALTDAEQRVATACKGLIRRFRWQDSVAEKDNNPDSDETARYHFGVIAQDLQDAFEAEGLDASDYGMFISSTWTDDDGVEQTRLGVRYNELLSFIITTL
ncbi:MAG: tail fiber domain-containing protein, partial [Perlucidibaca sp.]